LGSGEKTSWAVVLKVVEDDLSPSTVKTATALRSPS
jgi:hypothetical protein